MNSALEQFKITVYYKMSFLGIDISVTTVTLVLLSSFLIYSFLLKGELITSNAMPVSLVPTRWRSVLELMYLFVHDLIKQQVGNRGLIYMPLMFTLFYFILFLNLLGMLPIGFTVTSQIINTFAIGGSFFLGVIVIGLKLQGFSWFKLFVPSGAPKALLPALVVIEVFSYIIRPFSLSIRLFANMLAGHTLLHILASFANAIFKVSMLTYLGFFVVFFILIVTVLELGIACLQAYVFVTLVLLYLSESFHGH